MKKDTIYIDIEDEITTITEKLQSAHSEIVAMVLPKHCAVLQSAVNMKILNKTAKDVGKRVVLITSEASLLPLAGSAGLYVAKTLQSKPYLPELPVVEEPVTAISTAQDMPQLDKSKPIGELAVAAGGVAVNDEAPIELGDEASDEKTTKTAKKNRKLKVPNFDKFRLWLFLSILAVALLIAGGVYAAAAMPKAMVTITTENKTVTVKTTLTGSLEAKTVDITNKIAPAQVKTIEQPVTKKFTATGKKDVGNKASGKVIFYNCSKDDKLGDIDRTVPTGTGVSASGLTFITQKEVVVKPSTFIGNNCLMNKPSEEVSVVAQFGGDKYNVSARDYDVAGFASMTAADEDGMGGGTTKLVTVVSQTDCDTAKNELLNTKTDDYKNQLAAQLSTVGLLPIRDTFVSATGAFSCNPEVDKEAAESTATLQFKLTMSGVNITSLEKIVQTEVNKQLKGTQSIFDTGVKTAVINVTEKKPNGDIVFAMQTDAQTGIKKDAEAVAKLIAGKKYGESLTTLKAQAGVADAKINYSPFWVTKTPKDVKRISVDFIDNGSN